VSGTLEGTQQARPTSAPTAFRCSTSVVRSRRFATAFNTSTGVDSDAATATAMGQHRLQFLVHAILVQPLYQLRHRQLEDLTDAEEGGHRDRPTGLHLLPMAGRKAEAEHVLL